MYTNVQNLRFERIKRVFTFCMYHLVASLLLLLLEIIQKVFAKVKLIHLSLCVNTH